MVTADYIAFYYGCWCCCCCCCCCCVNSILYLERPSQICIATFFSHCSFAIEDVRRRREQKNAELFFVLYTCASDVCVNRRPGRRRGKGERTWNSHLLFNYMYSGPWEGGRDGKQQQVGGGSRRGRLSKNRAVLASTSRAYAVHCTYRRTMEEQEHF